MRIAKIGLSLLLTIGLFSCGGGGGGGSNPTPGGGGNAPSTQSTIRGNVTLAKGLRAGDTVIMAKVNGIEDATAVVAADGTFSIDIPKSSSARTLNVDFMGSGIVETREQVIIPANAISAGVSTTLIPQGKAYTFDPSVASVVQTDSKAVQLSVPANAFEFADGTLPSGDVTVNITEVDLKAENGAGLVGAPDLMGVRSNSEPDAAPRPIYTFGMSKFDFSQGGKKLQLKKGKQAEIKMPMNTAMLYGSENAETATTPASDGDEIPMWYFDEEQRVWKEEGVSVVTADSSTPSGFSLVGKVNHFTWWNVDDVCPTVGINVVLDIYDKYTGEDINEFVEVDAYTVTAWVNSVGFHGSAPWRSTKVMSEKDTGMSVIGNTSDRSRIIEEHPQVTGYTTIQLSVTNISIDGELLENQSFSGSHTPIAGGNNTVTFRVPYEFAK